jgi:hypothetical protein
MSFYLNDFKNHLQKLADNVDLPYDEPAMRSRTTKTIEETYSGMGCSSCKKKQQLTEQGGIQGGLGQGAPRFNTSGGVGYHRPQNKNWAGVQGGQGAPRFNTSGGVGYHRPQNKNWAELMMKNNKRRPSSRWGGTGDGPPGGV